VDGGGARTEGKKREKRRAKGGKGEKGIERGERMKSCN